MAVPLLSYGAPRGRPVIPPMPSEPDQVVPIEKVGDWWLNAGRIPEPAPTEDAEVCVCVWSDVRVLQDADSDEICRACQLCSLNL